MTSRYPSLIAAVAAVPGLLFGFDTAVINGALSSLREELNLTTQGTEIAVSSLLGGCAVGAGFAGMLTDRFGRKKLLILSTPWGEVAVRAAELGDRAALLGAVPLLAGGARG